MNSQFKIIKYLEKAKNISFLSDFPRQHLGAIMVLGNKIIASGYNLAKTSPIQKQYNSERSYSLDTINNGQIHAEMHCLLQTRYFDNVDWGKVDLYVYREHKDGSPSMARACPACMKALKDRGIKNIYYSTEFSPEGYAHEKIN